MMKSAAIAGLAALSLLAAPALAQDLSPEELDKQRMQELSCVYQGVSTLDDEIFFGLGVLLLAEQREDPKFLERMEHVTAVADACASDYDWDEERTAFAVEMAMQGVISDTIATDMNRAGMTPEQIQRIDDLVLTLSDENLDRLFYGTWRDNADEQAELEKLWDEAGIPSDGTFVNMLPRYMETSVVMLDLIGQWMDSYID